MHNYYNLKDFYQKFSTKAVSPKAVQRNVCWANENKAKWIRSLNMDTVWSSSINMVDVRESLDRSKRFGTKVDREFFKHFYDRGFEWLIIDGQNRTYTAFDFYDNKFTVSGTFVDQRDQEHTLQNVFFKDMPESLQMRFLNNCRISVAPITVATRQECIEMFLDYNDGIPVNRMEKRDASFSAIADWVRQQAEKVSEPMKRIESEDKIIRGADKEWIISMCMHLMKNYHPTISAKFGDIDDDSMDKWYDIGKDCINLADPNNPHLQSELRRCEQILYTTFHDVFDSQSKYQTKNGKFATYMAWATLYVVEWAHDNGYNISDYREFFDSLYTIDRKLASDSDAAFASQYEAWLNATPAGRGQEPKKSWFYSHWSGVHKSSPMRTRRIKALIDEITKPENLKKLKMVKQAAIAAK